MSNPLRGAIEAFASKSTFLHFFQTEGSNPCLSAKKKATLLGGFIYGGEAGIRTLGRDKPTPVFKTGAFDHSATSPGSSALRRGPEEYLKIT
jgi:hypothetical protein